MEKKNSFWSNFEYNRKYQIVFFIISMCVILGVYTGLRANMQTKKAKEYTIGEHNDLIRYIDNVEITDKNITISGWCFYTGVDSSSNQVQVILRNTEDKEDVILLDTESVIRDDVDAYYDCNVDYSQTGFVATGKTKNLSLDTKNYEIIIKLNYEVEKTVIAKGAETVIEKKTERTVSTKQYLCNGELTALMPGEEPAQTDSAFLNEIFEKGQLMLYRKDKDVYVYQYGTKMYWIAGEDFYFKENGKTKIQFHFRTTRSDLLPNKEKGETWNNSSFYFENNEIRDKKTEPYRVSVCDIPTEYPVAHFWTGFYTNSEWVWKEYRTPNISELRGEER